MRRRTAAALTVACPLLCAALALLAGSAPGRSVDEHVLGALNEQSGWSPFLSLSTKLDARIAPIVAVWAVVLAVVAFRRRRSLLIPAALVLPALSALTAEGLKHAISVAHDKLGASLPTSLDHTWPSAHAAAVAPLTLLSYLLAWSRVERIAAVVLGVALAICPILNAAHFPSDVLGGTLIGIAWGSSIWATMPEPPG